MIHLILFALDFTNKSRTLFEIMFHLLTRDLKLIALLVSFNIQYLR